MQDARFLDDELSLSVFREFFVAAVEQNTALGVTMKVVETVDSVIQDYMQAEARRHKRREVCSRLFLCVCVLP